MNILRKIALFIITPVFSLAILLLLISFVVVSFLGTSKPIKETLAKSHIYDHMVQSALDKVKDESQKDNSKPGDQKMQQPGMPMQNQEQEKKDDINLNAPEIKNAAAKAFTPAFMQKTTETIIDGVYGWLDGKTAEPEFTIDISKPKTTFIESIADAAAKKVEALPVCTSLEQAQQSGNDPFTATCKPPDFNAQGEKAKFLEKFNGEESPIKQNTISYKDLQKDGKENPTDKIKNVPKIFQLVKKLPLIMFILAVVLTGLIMLLAIDHLKGIRMISTTFFTIGITALIVCGIMTFATLKLTGTAKSENQLQTDAFSAAHFALTSIRNSVLIGAVCYVIIGIIGWIVVHKLQKPLSDEQKENNVNKVVHTKELDDKDAVALDDKPKDPKEELDTDKPKEVK